MYFNFTCGNTAPQQPSVLDFVENHFQNTPISELNKELLLKKCLDLCKKAHFASSLCHYLNIAIQLGLNQTEVQALLLRAKSLVRCQNDVDIVYKTALKLFSLKNLCTIKV